MRIKVIRTMGVLVALTVASSCQEGAKYHPDGGRGGTPSAVNDGGVDAAGGAVPMAGSGGAPSDASGGRGGQVGGYGGGSAPTNSGAGGTPEGGSAGSPGTGAAAGNGAASGGAPGIGGLSGTGGPASGGVGTSGRAGAGGVGTDGAAGKPGSGGLGGAGNGTGGATVACQPNATQCAAGNLQTCGANGQWGAATPCDVHRTCSGPAGTAQCMCTTDPVCKSNGSVCSSTTALVSCAMDGNGCFYQASSMTCANGACSDGHCCNTACSGSCFTCSTGTCMAKTGNPSTDSACNGACVNLQTDPRNCGTCDHACGSGQHCTAGSCACPSDAALRCNSCLSWDFESGLTSGWAWSTRNDGTGILAPIASAGRGSYSLMLRNVSLPNVTSDIIFRIALCNGSSVAVPSSGFTFSVDVLFQSNGYGFGDDGTGSGAPGVILEGDAGAAFSHLIASEIGPFANGTWYRWSWTFPGSSVGTLDLRFSPQAPWYGNIIIDNVLIK